MSDPFADRARHLDAADPLGWARGRFAPLPDDVVAYLDGNSLGRPVQASVDAMARFTTEAWAGRLIRGWGEGWMTWPEALGDRIGDVALGAGAGQVVVADSTSVLLYKLARAALAVDPRRRTVVVDSGDFPTDRDLLDGIAAETGVALRAVATDPAGGITPAQVAAAVGPDTALVVLSHVSYRSGWVADVAAITSVAHDAGALVLWDLSHAAGAVPVHLDRWGVDMAVGCCYKYLNGGPGAPAWAYLAGRHHQGVSQPVWGWMGRTDPFAMDEPHHRAPGVRALLSGSPPIVGMVPLWASLDLLAEAGMMAVREKSVLLTGFTLDMVDAVLGPVGVTVASPRAEERRGGHITLTVPGARAVVGRLWAAGVVPDARDPDGVRLGLAPLSTSFAEVHRAVLVLRDQLVAGSAGAGDARSPRRQEAPLT